MVDRTENSPVFKASCLSIQHPMMRINISFNCDEEIRRSCYSWIGTNAAKVELSASTLSSHSNKKRPKINAQTSVFVFVRGRPQDARCSQGNNSGRLKLTSRDVMDSVEGVRYGPVYDSATSKLKKSFTLRSCSLCTRRGGAQIPSNKPACDSRAAAVRPRLQTHAKYLILFT